MRLIVAAIVATLIGCSVEQSVEIWTDPECIPAELPPRSFLAAGARFAEQVQSEEIVECQWLYLYKHGATEIYRQVYSPAGCYMEFEDQPGPFEVTMYVRLRDGFEATVEATVPVCE